MLGAKTVRPTSLSWYGLCHRRRIGPSSWITFILEPSEWPIAKDAEPFSRRFNARQWETFYDLVNVFIFDIGSICFHGKELFRQFTFRQKYRENLTLKTIFDISEQMIVCLKSLGKVLHGNIYLWLILKKSSVSRMQRFTYSQILCYVSEKMIQNPTNIAGEQQLEWFKDWSKYRTLDTIDGEPMEFEWNFPQDSQRWSLSAKSKSSWAIWANPNTSNDESSSCRCSMTPYGEIKTMKRNVLLIPHLCLYSQKDFQQDVGHSSDLDQKRSGILFIIANHKENGTESLNWWWSNSEKADTQFSEPRVRCLEERSKAKEVWNFLYTSVPMEIWLKLFFAQSFLSISSVSTEESQDRVRNTVQAM